MVLARFNQIGTCKHYGKSYRWFRFDCCKRLYPCDVCHESLSEPHETLPASRIVCGFCSKEQKAVTDSPCTGCAKDMTRSRGSGGAFWEGLMHVAYKRWSGDEG
jgi:uncharacterized CHY-type Zn-finger protein